jgi:PAS domain S-box-containing protein
MIVWIIIIGGLISISLATYLKFQAAKKTELSPAEEASSGQKSSSSTVLEAVSDGVVILDSKGVIKMINPAACALSGWQQKDAIGIDHRSVFKLSNEKGKPYEDSDNPLSRTLADGKTHRDSNAILTENGSNKSIVLSMSVSPLFDSEQEINGAIGILRDISQEKQAEKQRAEFISTASHEMRTPVASIEGYLALAMNPKVSNIDDKARSYLVKAHAATQHLGSLFQDLLTSAKVEDGRLTNHPSVVEMSSFLTSLTEDLKFVVKKNIAVEFVVGNNGALIKPQEDTGSIRVVQPIYNIYADPERIREVVTNLFDNAVKYTESGKITIGLTGDNDIVQLYIKDTGKGIPSNDIPHLFQKFYRVDSSDTRTESGTGLGLFITRKIIEMYRGRIWVESKVGQGSTFYINIPRLNNQQAAELSGNSTTKTVKPTT